MSIVAPLVTLAAAAAFFLGSEHQHLVQSRMGRLASRKLARLLAVLGLACWVALLDAASGIGAALVFLMLGLVAIPALAALVSPQLQRPPRRSVQ